MGVKRERPGRKKQTGLGTEEKGIMRIPIQCCTMASSSRVVVITTTTNN